MLVRCSKVFIVAFVVAASAPAAGTEPVPSNAPQIVPVGATSDNTVRTDTVARVGDTVPSSAAAPKSDTSAQPIRQSVPDIMRQSLVPSLTDTPPRAAVIDFMGRGIDSLSAQGFSDRVRLLLSNYSALPVMGLLEMNDSLSARTWHGDRACDHNDCFVEMGRALGVRYILGGSAGKIGEISTLALRLIDITTGKVLLFELVDTRLKTVEILGSLLPELVVEFNNALLCAGASIIAIQSEPPGAEVRFDQTPVGTTPVLLKNIRNGPHDLQLRLPDYSDVVDTLTLESGVRGGKRYTLKPTDASVAAFRDKQRAVWMARGAGLLGAIASLSIGLHYNARLGTVETAQRRIVDEYDAAGIDADPSLYAERYRHQSKRFETWTAYRNLWYAAGVVFAAGVGVTFLF